MGGLLGGVSTRHSVARPHRRWPPDLAPEAREARWGVRLGINNGPRRTGGGGENMYI